MAKKVIIKKVFVEDFINVLKIFKKKGKKYINLECIINEVQDDVRVYAYKKKDSKPRKKKLTEAALAELLKFI